MFSFFNHLPRNIRINTLEEESLILEQDNQFYEFIYNEAEDSYINYRGTITKNNTGKVFPHTRAFLLNKNDV